MLNQEGVLGAREEGSRGGLPELITLEQRLEVRSKCFHSGGEGVTGLAGKFLPQMPGDSPWCLQAGITGRCWDPLSPGGGTQLTRGRWLGRGWLEDVCYRKVITVPHFSCLFLTTVKDFSTMVTFE